MNKLELQEIPDFYSHKIVRLLVKPNSIESLCLTKEGKLISRAFSCLKDSEKNYTEVKKNMLALDLAYRKFGPYMKGKISVYTATKQLKKSLEMKEISERISRILLKLPPDADFEIIFEQGAKQIEKIVTNTVPDDIFYTDGACSRNGKEDCKSAWAEISINNPKLSCSGLVPLERHSNNIAELYAARQALRIAIESGMKDIVIVSDSKNVCGTLNEWIDKWIENDWCVRNCVLT